MLMIHSLKKCFTAMFPVIFQGWVTKELREQKWHYFLTKSLLLQIYCTSAFIQVKWWAYAVGSQNFWRLTFCPRVGRRLGFCNKLPSLTVVLTLVKSSCSDIVCGHMYFVLFVLNGTFSTNRPYHPIDIWNIYCLGPGGTHSNINKPNERKIHTNTSSTWALRR